MARVEPKAVTTSLSKEQTIDAVHPSEEGKLCSTEQVARRKRETKVQIKTRVSQSEAEEMERLTRPSRPTSGPRSMAARSHALWSLAIRSQDEFATVIRQRGPCAAPNGDSLGMAQFEDQIATVLQVALSRAFR